MGLVIRAALVCALLLCPGVLAGQTLGSAYLPLGHWAYDYVNVLLARGKLPNLAPLVQPYRRLDVVRSIRSAQTGGRLSRAELAWVAELEKEMDYEARLLSDSLDRDLRFERRLSAGLSALSQEHRDVLRPEGDEHAYVILELDLLVDAPNLASGFRMRWDGRYVNDPQFPGGQAIPFRACDPLIDQCAYRVEDGYVELQLPYASLFFGRMNRNWGVAGEHGFLVSNYPYSYDHIGYRFGSARLALTGLFAPLNDFGGDTARYFASHRFDWRLRENLVVSGSESTIYGGPNRRVDFNLINPVGIWEISPSGGAETNTLGMAEVWWRPRPGLVTYLAMLVDNTLVGEPNAASWLAQWGAHLSVQLPAVRSNLALRGDLALANSLAYRSRVDRAYYYAFDNLGLGRDKSDALVASLRADWFMGARGILQPRMDFMWRGADDIRQPWPAEGFAHDPFFVGTTETTFRPALAGRWRFPRGEIEWDAGLNLIKNEDNTVQGWKARFVGRAQLTLRTRF